MLILFSPIFVADTKIIFRYDFAAPLTPYWFFIVYHEQGNGKAIYLVR